ncbi:MAG: hypothetical protein IPN29_12980 [Saprospiraceae bacterium]|nr:hypothetical protein [Saprospiraceae bacterium]
MIFFFIRPKLMKIGLLTCINLTWLVFAMAQMPDTIDQPPPETLETGANDSGGLVNFLSVQLGSMSPQSAFAGKVPEHKFQFGVSYYRQMIKEKPLFLGVDFTYVTLSHYGTEIPFEQDGETVFWDVSTTSSMITLDITSRYYLPLKVLTVDLFAEFNAGFNWMHTSTSFTPPDDEEAAETNNNKNDLVGKYGITGGLHIPLASSSYLQFRLGYHPGLSAYYFTLKDSITPPVESTIEGFELQKTTTDQLKWDIGYTFAF